MRSHYSRTLMLGFVCSLLWLSPVGTQSDDVAFVNVNVVPMDRERIVAAQTVWISGGRIKAMGRVREVALPPGVQRVDGTGKYLMPGLADMHGHLSHRGPALAYPLETFPLLLVAHGVTTMRNMAGYPAVLSLRQQIDTGATIGPQIFTTGPVLEGKTAVTANNSAGTAVAALAGTANQSQMLFLDTPEEASIEVERQKRDGYDAVKVYNLLPAPAFEAVVRTARAVGLPVYGHVPRSVGLSGALAARIRSVEHLGGYMEALQTENSPFKDSPFSPSTARMADDVDLTKLPALARATREAGVWNCPTLVLLPTGTLDEASVRQRLQLPVMRYVAPARKQVWEEQIRALNSKVTPADLAVYANAHRVRMQIVKALHDAGAGLIAGTDFAGYFLVPGYSLHEELQNLVAAGLTPFEALRTATADAAEFMNRANDFGTVGPGKRADLLLLAANPLEDVRNATRLQGVMVHGRWFTDADLHARLEVLARSFTTQ
jgi:imidazolonepropionase-like amidohydrolase